MKVILLALITFLFLCCEPAGKRNGCVYFVYQDGRQINNECGYCVDSHAFKNVYYLNTGDKCKF